MVVARQIAARQLCVLDCIKAYWKCMGYFVRVGRLGLEM